MTSDFPRRKILQYVGGIVGTVSLAGAGAANDLIEINIGYANPQGRSAALDAATDIKHEFNFDALTIRAASQTVETMGQDPNIRYVEENGQMHTLSQTTPYGIETVGADITIEDGSTGDGVSIAIIDTGIDPQHETLEANLGEGWAAADVACTTNCGGDGNEIDECLEDWDDDDNHGTHVAGMAGAADNGEGILGVAPDATLHAVKALSCEGIGTFDNIAAGIEWSADQGHDVQNLSFGNTVDSGIVTDALEYAADRNVVLVAAAGNQGPCNDCVIFPGRDERVIAASATDENDDLAEFSSTGPEVDLAAPGVELLSTIPRDDYATFSGTSIASPHVAGAAAIVIENGTTDREAVRDQLVEAADDIELDETEQGAGRLNVAAAVDADDADDEVSIPPLPLPFNLRSSR